MRCTAGPTATAARPGGGVGPWDGLLLGFVGVAIFSLSLPVTRRAVQEIDASFVAFGRMALAGIVAAAYLAEQDPSIEVVHL